MNNWHRKLKKQCPAVRLFARGEPQSDDIALLALRWLAPAELSVELAGTVAEVARGYQTVQAFLAGKGVGEDVVHDVGLAVVTSGVGPARGQTPGQRETLEQLERIQAMACVRSFGKTTARRMQRGHAAARLDRGLSE